ncbi:sugar-binding transcriptional regulator [Paludibaculum fermentans]|uniref:Sugar-binding transcriptional regulator n=1 Tax=Paludibaculum fermentans TaxID=1473598 RepID=A0A7S7SLM1_PALFE|nr:sugar-binding transcriptional regulator [Paludibaculum fermentans]QOY88596.1 sugar-binding transcriptional regulator [Paludibaculum fermentans]
MARIDELRLIAKVARMYYGQGLRQTEIMERLNVSQSTISRLLKKAEVEGIVRITVAVPSGTHPELEEALQSHYALKEVIVVDCIDDEAQIARDLGAAAAFYMETTLRPGDVIGISSWSAALLAMVDAMHPSQRCAGARVVQILGGIGNPAAEVHATHVTRRLANLIGGTATLLPAPGVLGTVEAKQVMQEDQYVRQACELFGVVSVALVGIGAIEPSHLLTLSGNVFSGAELKELGERGAVGDICLRFFDGAGMPVVSPLNERVIGMSLEELRKVSRVVGVAGGRRKLAAIRGALAGKWINVLITDRLTASQLLESSTAANGAGRVAQVSRKR